MKTTTCAFCGQELKKGTLGIGGNRKQLYVGTFLDCCPHCYEKYENFAHKDDGRFWTKLESVFYTPGKRINLEKQLTQQEIASYYVRYYEDAQQYCWNLYSRQFGVVPCKDDRFAYYMSMLEASPYSFVNDLSLGVLLEDMEKQVLQNMMLCQEYIFNNFEPFASDDISCLEYTYNKQSNEDDVSLFHLRIKLNDPRQLTYRPCVITCAVFCPAGLQETDSCVETHMMKFMLHLRALLQVENMPIIKRDTVAELYSNGHAPATANPPKKSITDYPLLQKFADFFENLADKFRALRSICCFLAVLSTIGFIMFLSTSSVTDAGYALSGIFMLVGCVSALLACPMRFLEIIVGLAAGGFSIGLFFALIGSIVGGGIGLALGVALLIYAPAFVTIPYYFKELR